MGVMSNLLRRLWGSTPPAVSVPARDDRMAGEDPGGSSERGFRPTLENALRYQYRSFYVDPDLRQRILDIREMDQLDGRVKKIHNRMARSAVKGGLRLEWSGGENARVQRQWDDFRRRLGLKRQAKLESDARGLVMEGNLPMQWVLGADRRVHAGIRMPSETIVPMVALNGRFEDPTRAYVQMDLLTAREVAAFPLWQLTLERLSPDNIDDLGALGRPYLDSVRPVWRKLQMTEEDLVIRRRQRAPLRMSHILEGANDADLQAYQDRVENERNQICTDYYSNKKGSVTALQGDANLDQIADVAHLLDTFFAGSPAPKGLFGYVGDLSRDILEDLKRDYYEEIDALQDTLSWVYDQGFRLDLMLAGINPAQYGFEVVFAERRTESPNQAADRALKYQALGVPKSMVWDTAGLDPTAVEAARKREADRTDPYPDPTNITPLRPPRVSITPNNAPKGESATNIGGGGQ